MQPLSNATSTPIAIPRSSYASREVSADFDPFLSTSPAPAPTTSLRGNQSPPNLAPIDTSHLSLVVPISASTFATLPGDSPRPTLVHPQRLREAPPREKKLRVYEPIDFARAVSRQVGKYDYTYKCSPGQLREVLPKAQEIENRRIALQSALMSVFLENPNAEIATLNFGNIGMGPEVFRDLKRIQALVRSATFEFNPQTGRYLNSSGLRVQPTKDWNVMSLDKHMLMRISPLYRFNKGGQSITGKIYADFLDFTNKSSRQTMLEAFKQAPFDQQVLGESPLEVSQIQHEMEFRDQKYIFQHAFNAVMRAAQETQNSVTLDKIEEASTSHRPAIVEWADDATSDAYISLVRFSDRGSLEIQLPPMVISQFEGDVPHDNGASVEPHLLVFVQDLDGNVKTTRHKDTHYHHSTPNGGRPVRTAGELFGRFSVENSGLSTEKVIFHVDKICNKSGHYWPKIATLGHFRDDLIASGLDARTVEFIPVLRDTGVRQAMTQWSQNNEPSVLPQSELRENSNTSLIQELREHLQEVEEEWV